MTQPTKRRCADGRPNVIYIVADDLGYADLGCYGGREAPFGKVSPELDELAAAGLCFTQGYANSPVCSPTRYALMTGRYQYRLRGAADEPTTGAAVGSKILGLSPEHPTMPSLLRAAGYRTALVGKWHLGFAPHFGPLKSGYEEYFGVQSGGVDYFHHVTSGRKHDLWEGDEEVFRDGYLTDMLSDRAVDVVQRHAAGDAPFMISLHYTAPHWPWETRDDRARSDEVVKGSLFHLDGGNIATYLRMIHHMDEGIGRVVQALREAGQLDNTLILFTSDNGGERFSDNWPLVGGKMDLTEGGIRVPWIVHWPAVVAAGGRTSQHAMTMDFTATVLDAAGVAADADHPLDGVSMLPVLRGAATSIARPMHWRMNHKGQRALRDGRWKYLRVQDHDYLFDIEADARERANLAAREPARLAAMRGAWEAWNATMPAIPPDAVISLGYGVKDMPPR